jgi:tRNA uridine 5-carboxymethylaminomethyl modification enzyme
MFTSRAEYRILLRQDNADLRLTEKGYQLGLASQERIDRLNFKKEEIKAVANFVKKTKFNPEEINTILENLGTAIVKEKISLDALIRRPNVSLENFKGINKEIDNLFDTYSIEAIEQVEIYTKYESYIDKEEKLASKITQLEDYRIAEDYDYSQLPALSAEARQKFSKIKPRTIGQASRISGVTPSDISILMVYLEK